MHHHDRFARATLALFTQPPRIGILGSSYPGSCPRATLSLYSRTSWKRNSPNFALTQFYEVRAGLSGRGAVYRRRTTLFCTERHGIFGAHSALVPALRRRVFIFPSRNSASATPSTRFTGSSPLSNPIVQATPLRATCFFVRSTRTSSAKWSATNGRICPLPLYGLRPGNGAEDTSSASSAKKPITASGSRLLQASSKASAARNSSALSSPWDVRSSIKRGSRFAFEAVPRDWGKRERDSSITRTTICLYLPSRERSPSSSSWSIFSMEWSSW